MVVLEAFMMQKPVLVHKACEVMKDHVDNSGGGYYYNDYASFKTAFNLLTSDQQLNMQIGKSGKQYVKQYYEWGHIISIFKNSIEFVTGNS